jgi:transcriptional regulator NrdR family protein
VSQADSGVLKNIMICPNPKGNHSKTNVKSEKQEIKRNEVLRNRYCSKCDTSFSTKEKINIITKKKPRTDKLLMNFRF